jgi:hypothetical protein
MFSTPTLLIGLRLPSLLIRRRLVRSNVHHRVLMNLFPTISAHFRLRSFVRRIRLIRLFFLFFPIRLGCFGSPFFPHKFRRVWKSAFSVCATYIFLFSRLILPLPIPSIDCLLLGFCQSNLLAIFVSPAVDGITLSFLSPLSVCYRLD